MHFAVLRRSDAPHDESFDAAGSILDDQCAVLRHAAEHAHVTTLVGVYRAGKGAFDAHEHFDFPRRRGLEIFRAHHMQARFDFG